jgi:hypothetical protein
MQGRVASEASRALERGVRGLFQRAGAFLRQGATGSIVGIEAVMDRLHFRVKQIADTDDDKVFDVHFS